MNIHARKLNIDLTSLEERWNFYKEIENRKELLENTRIEIGQKITKLMKESSSSDDSSTTIKEIEKLKFHIKIVKDDLKNVRSMSYGIEEGAILKILNLPNKLHEKTPINNGVEIYRYLEEFNNKKLEKDHITIGREQGFLNLINSMSCYLKSDAALFEFAIQNYFNDELLSNLNYTQFSNCDFVKSIVVEGCGSNFSDLLTLENIHCINSDNVNRLHLVGASSLYPFMAYFTKNLLNPSNLPQQLFCIGRIYENIIPDEKNLFHLNQSSNIGVFIAVKQEVDKLEEIINTVTNLYNKLGLHYRLVLTAAHNLKNAESLKISIQMFSNYLQSYIEVGNVSFYEDYLSKRLLFSYNEKNNERKFPNIIAGRLINIHKVLGCALENNFIEGKPLLNDFLYKYC